MSQTKETLGKVKRQRDSAINAVRELADMIDGHGAMACFWCKHLHREQCPADCNKRTHHQHWEFGGTISECAEGVSPWIEPKP